MPRWGQIGRLLLSRATGSHRTPERHYTRYSLIHYSLAATHPPSLPWTSRGHRNEFRKEETTCGNESIWLPTYMLTGTIRGPRGTCSFSGMNPNRPSLPWRRPSPSSTTWDRRDGSWCTCSRSGWGTIGTSATLTVGSPPRLAGPASISAFSSARLTLLAKQRRVEVAQWLWQAAGGARAGGRAAGRLLGAVPQETPGGTPTTRGGTRQ